VAPALETFVSLRKFNVSPPHAWLSCEQIATEREITAPTDT
jgi:hypothetical protein